MTVVKTWKKSRLAKEIFQPGGMAVRVAIARAEASLESLHDRCQEVIDATLAELEATYCVGSSAPAARDFGNLYRVASRIIDAAICMPGSEIDKAANALCDLADRSEESGVWDQECVDVHIQVLKLLRTGGDTLTNVQRQRMVAGLKQATSRRLGDR
ncbi:MAG: chemotaxis protein CheE [Caulobacteraceae bacterium]|nr:chemotaxis protein CheE [Caulobacter sp.]RYF95793.1 MAG: chemotaxis protein CheE [Caulobacteraceae bacterium]